MARTAIRLESVALAFPLQRRIRGGNYWALKCIDLELCHGDKLGVLGRNGAGKSTLLRVLSGAMVPDKGRVTRDHGRIQLLTLSLGFVSHLTGRDNAILSGLLQGLDRPAIDSKLEAIREFSELGEFFDRPINTYSSGMTSRLGFSVAMQLEPDVLLIDETLGVGDAAFRKKSSEALRERFHGDHTVVLVSHNEKTVTELCDKLLWIEDGRTVMFGTADDVMGAYQAASTSPKSRRPVDEVKGQGT